MKPSIDIISTASLPTENLQRLQQYGFNTEVIPFIKTYASVSSHAIQRIKTLEKYKATAVFTSVHGVESVVNCLVHAPVWKIACINGQTKKVVERYFDESSIIASAPDSASLAKAMIGISDEPVIFFCGSRRLDALPQLLKDAGVALEEIEVYKTDLTPQAVNDKEAKAVLFFSTSAVDSFFTMNTLSPETVCFAIGETTASALRQKVNNEIVVADQPGKKELVDLVIKYYHEHS